MGEMTIVVTPADSFVITPMGTQPLPASQKAGIMEEAHSELFYVLKNADRFSFAAGGTEKIGDVDAAVVEVSGEGAAVTWYIHPETGALLREKSGEQVVDIQSWQMLGGYNVPKAMTITANGAPAGSAEIVSFEPNPAVDEKAFAKP
jgi:hypothetical protein